METYCFLPVAACSGAVRESRLTAVPFVVDCDAGEVLVSVTAGRALHDTGHRLLAAASPPAGVKGRLCRVKLCLPGW